MRDMKVLHTIRDVPSNREGLCALSSNNDNSYLAYPGSSITGEVQVFDTLNLVCKIKFFILSLYNQIFMFTETRYHD
jgi:autophagy-related protein 18